MKIITGKKKTGARIKIFGPQGSGKSTLAANWCPASTVFISGQDGATELNVPRWCFDEKTDRTYAQDWQELLDAARGAKALTNVTTIVFDELGVMEQRCIEYVCDRPTPKWKSLAEPGYGKGESALLSEMNVLLKAIEELWATGKDIIFTLHAKQGKVPNPGGADDYRRWEPALISANNADVCGRFSGWCDAVFYLTPEVDITKVGEDKKKKAIGSATGRRILYTQEDTGYFAKCRFRNVPQSMYIPRINPMAEIRALIAEGQSAEAMRKKVAGLAEKADAASAKVVADALAGAGGKDIGALNDMAEWLSSMRGEKAAA